MCIYTTCFISFETESSFYNSNFSFGNWKKFGKDKVIELMIQSYDIFFNAIEKTKIRWYSKKSNCCDWLTEDDY